jgi:hypothetical protein
LIVPCQQNGHPFGGNDFENQFEYSSLDFIRAAKRTDRCIHFKECVQNFPLRRSKGMVARASFGGVASMFVDKFGKIFIDILALEVNKSGATRLDAIAMHQDLGVEAEAVHVNAVLTLVVNQNAAFILQPYSEVTTRHPVIIEAYIIARIPPDVEAGLRDRIGRVRPGF